ncbi:hypothetical protein BH11PAT4_BH11PAT4_5490 [soil metagenome]
MKGFVKAAYVLGLLLLCAAARAGQPVETIEKMVRCKLSEIKAYVSYVPGGTTRQALEKKHAGKGLIRVVSGGYFNPDAKPLSNVDYTLVKGRMRVSYLTKKLRPIIFFSPRYGARIEWVDPAQGQFLRHREEYDGLAVDYCCQKPAKRLCRTIIGITKTTLSVYQVRGTEQACRDHMLAQGFKIDQYVFTDGGDSTLKTTSMPSHILIFKKSG